MDLLAELLAPIVRVIVGGFFFLVGYVALSVVTFGRLRPEFGTDFNEHVPADAVVRNGWFTYARGGKTYVGPVTTGFLGVLALLVVGVIAHLLIHAA